MSDLQIKALGEMPKDRWVAAIMVANRMGIKSGPAGSVLSALSKRGFVKEKYVIGRSNYRERRYRLTIRGVAAQRVVQAAGVQA